MRTIIFTDLDGTLLDNDSYSHHAAGPALAALRQQEVPLVLCTSKTRLETEAVRVELGNKDPFIVENGAAVLVPRGYFPFPMLEWNSDGPYEVLPLGLPYPKVTDTLRRASETSGCAIRGFHNMSIEEVAIHSGLTIRAAELAKDREYDEPFQFLTDSPSEICRLLNRIEAEGLTWTRGGRFYHVQGLHNKGEAAKILASLFRRLSPDIVSVGLGDGPNDISLLEAVDVPIVIPSPHKENPTTWRRSTASWRHAPHPGPTGWNQAILGLLAERDLPTTGSRR